jgi:hypothetical protein
MRYARIPILLCSLLMSWAIAGAQPLDEERVSTDVSRRDMHRVKINGEVQSIRGGRAVVETPDGDRVNVNLGPQSYWRDRGYHLDRGDRVTIEGWRERDDDDDDFAGPVFAGSMWGPDFSFELTNEDGWPLWCDPADCPDGWYPTLDFYDTCYFYNPPVAYAPAPAPAYYGIGFYWGWPWYHHRRFIHYYRGWDGGFRDHRGWHDRGWNGGGHRGGGEHHGGWNGGGNNDHRGGGNHRDSGGNNGGGDHSGGGKGGNGGWHGSGNTNPGNGSGNSPRNGGGRGR